MSYFFPHATREAKRIETVEVFKQHYQAISDIEQRLVREFQETVPLWQSVIKIRMNQDNDWSYDDWREVYIQNGWTEVQGQKWYIEKTKLISPDLEWQGREELTEVEGSENWNDFINTIDGIEYKNSFPVDKQKYWAWIWWFTSKESFEKRLTLVIDASYDIDCLGYYTSIYIHEAFLIMIGVSTDKMERNEFRRWIIDSLALELHELDYYETKEDWFKKDFKEFKEWKILERQFGKGESGLGIEIDTEEFIEWALKNEIIEEDTAHFRDGRKAPYEESFSKMLHKELLANNLIKDGKHHHEWVWNTAVGNGFNSFNYLGRLLALNMLPIKYWLPLDRNSVSWENLEHYIAGVKNPKNQISMPVNARVIENIVQTLLVEHDKRPITEYKDFDDEE